MVKMKKTIILLIIMLIFSIFNIFFPIRTCIANGDTIYVDDDFDENTPGWQISAFDNIQAAINSDQGETIYVYSGTYNENIIINRTITLNGGGSSSTTIQGSGVHTIQITSDNVEISGFTIENDESSFICVKLEHVSNCEIKDNIIKNGGNGVQLIDSSNNNITDNTIKDNNVGIFFSYDSTTNRIKNNNIKDNNIYGIQISNSANFNFIYLNHFSNNHADNVLDLCSTTYWSYNYKGNYWDDYNDYDSNGDGTGENPYIINEYSQDDYPQGIFYNIQAIIDKIEPNPAVYGKTIYFYGDDTADNPVVNWEWKSNKNGRFGSSKNCQTSSLSLGSHTISFRIQDKNGEWSNYDQATLEIQSSSTPNQKPTAQIVTITPTTANYSESIYFHGLGQDSDGTIESYRWTSNIDGIISSDSTFYKSDLSIGTHTISFKVEDNDGEWSSTETEQIIILENPTSDNKPPVANPGGPYTGQVGYTINFDGSESYDPDTDDIISSYYWDFGDGNTGTGKEPTHTYTSAQDYTVYLTVTDNNGDQHQKATYANISLQSNNNNNENNNDNGDNNNDNNEDKNEQDENKGIPGFELFLLIIAIFVTLILKRKKT